MSAQDHAAAPDGGRPAGAAPVGAALEVAGALAADPLATELAILPMLSLAELRERWRALKGEPVPKTRPQLLRLALAYELQARAHGALPRRTAQRLDQLAAGRTRTEAVKPGMKLVRAWQGTLHTVTIDDAGVIHWNEQTWNSLSEVARAITGTRWSGPAFFGLKKRIAA